MIKSNILLIVKSQVLNMLTFLHKMQIDSIVYLKDKSGVDYMNVNIVDIPSLY